MNVSRLRSSVTRAPFHAYKQAMKRAVIPVRRRVLATRLDRLTPSAVTLVTANWHTLPFPNVIPALARRHCPPVTRLAASGPAAGVSVLRGSAKAAMGPGMNAS